MRSRADAGCFEPTIDYVVVKIPKWQFEVLSDEEAGAADEVGRRGDGDRATFKEALLKAVARWRRGSG